MPKVLKSYDLREYALSVWKSPLYTAEAKAEAKAALTKVEVDWTTVPLERRKLMLRVLDDVKLLTAGLALRPLEYQLLLSAADQQLVAHLEALKLTPHERRQRIAELEGEFGQLSDLGPANLRDPTGTRTGQLSGPTGPIAEPKSENFPIYTQDHSANLQSDLTQSRDAVADLATGPAVASGFAMPAVNEPAEASAADFLELDLAGPPIRRPATPPNRRLADHELPDDQAEELKALRSRELLEAYQRRGR